MLNWAIYFLKCFLDFALFAWICSLFFEKRYNLTRSILAILLFAALQQWVNMLFIPWLNTVSGLIISSCIALVLFKGNILQVCLCVTLSVSALLVCEFLPISILALFAQNNIVIIMSETIYDAAFNLIGTGLFCCVALIIKFATQRKRVGLSTNYFTLGVPALSVIVMYFMLYTSQYVPGNTRNTVLFITLYILIIFTNLCLILGERNVEKRITLEKELNELHYKDDLTSALIEQQDYFIEEMNGLRHDFKRQLIGLYSLAGASVSQALTEKYIDEVIESVDSIQSFEYIESLPLRVITNSTYNKCNRKGIDFLIDVRYSKFDFMSFPDIYSFFSNALDNAIEACDSMTDTSAKKYISLTIAHKNDMLLVQICNSYGIKPKRIENGFLSIKRHAGYHGFGTKNIWKIANKYQGRLTYDIGSDCKMTCLFTHAL